jgi:tyrosyl-tRNA synthetase
MTAPRSELLQVLKARGFIHDMTDEAGMDALLCEGPVTAYIGFDCTARSLHVGSLLQIMILRWFQKCGHRPIALMGGGTTRIGDPTGKDESRKMLTEEQIAENMNALRDVFELFLTFGDGPSEAIMLDNYDWLGKFNYLDFLRDYGTHFTINRMLTFESVKLRLEREQPMTFLEFNYMLLQAYDFLDLNRNHNCRIQCGGSDQWGNIINGVELVRRVDGKQAFGVVSPLVTTADGKKMGKTEQGAVWLNPKMLSAYDYWQFWRNTADADVGRFLKLFTEISLEEIARLEALEGQEINEAKKILATEATTMLHGKDAAEKAAATAQETFEGGGLSQDLPTVEVPLADLEFGIPAFDLFRRSGLASSGGEARRLVKGGGAKVNDTGIADENAPLGVDHISDDGVIKLSAGKKRHVLIKPV